MGRQRLLRAWRLDAIRRTFSWELWWAKFPNYCHPRTRTGRQTCPGQNSGCNVEISQKSRVGSEVVDLRKLSGGWSNEVDGGGRNEGGNFWCHRRGDGWTCRIWSGCDPRSTPGRRRWGCNRCKRRSALGFGRSGRLRWNGRVWELTQPAERTVHMKVLLALVAIFGVGIVLVIYGTLARNRWGINLEGVVCPGCNTHVPIVRVPHSIREALWGGGVCPRCGMRVDKWGRQVRS